MMQRNEGDLLAAWVAWHAAMFGHRNLHVFDNGSDDAHTLAVLDRCAGIGVTVSRRFSSRADFEAKGTILRDAAQAAARGGADGFVFFLDCDEFLAAQEAGGQVVADGAAVMRVLAGVARDGAAKVVTTSYINDPYRPDRFFRTSERKCFFEAGTVARLDLGFHDGVSTSGTRTACPGIVHLHFRMRPFQAMRAAAAAKLAGRVPDLAPEALRAYRAARGPGHHLVDFLLWDEAEYRAWLDRRPMQTIPVAAALARLGVRYPHAGAPSGAAVAGGAGPGGTAPADTDPPGRAAMPPTPAAAAAAAAAAGAAPVLHAAERLRDPDGFRRYVVEGGHATVQGWVANGALSAITAFDGLQRRHGVAGNICEIGVHHGRFLIALSLLRAPGEASLAIDVFDDQELNIDHSGRGDRAVFERNVARWLGPAPDMLVHQGDSLKVTGAEVLRRLGGPVRLFSVDGSHTCGHTLNDMRVAEDCVAEGGIVVVDDFLNPAWPGVIEAVVRYLDGTGGPPRLRPLGYGDNKFYLTTPGHADAYLAAIAGPLRPQLRAFKPVELCGQSLCHMGFPGPDVLLRANPAEPGRPLSFARPAAGEAGRDAPAPAEFIGAAFRAEASGTWACGRWAGIALGLPAELPAPQLQVELDIGCFRHRDDPAPRIGVHAFGREIAAARFPEGTDRIRLRVPFAAADLGQSRRLELWFDNPRARSPRSLGLSGDGRVLSFLLRSLVLRGLAATATATA